MRHAGILVLLVFGPSCSGQRAVVEDRGPQLAADVATAGAPSFAWLPGGAEIALVSGTPELVAVRIADGTRRNLDPARPSAAAGLARSRDGTALYFIAEDVSGDVPRYALREAFAHKQMPAADVMPSTPAVSSDARLVLYRTAKGPSLLEDSGAILSIPTCSGWPIPPVFSPSGDQLLCPGEPPTLLTLATGSTRALPETYLWRAVRWNAPAPQAVVLTADAQGERVNLVDVASGEKRVLYQPEDGLLEFAAAAISDDGRLVAFWESDCLHAESLLSCQAGQTEARLKVVEVASGRASTVASGAGGPGEIVFSDDGTRVAYVFQSMSGGALHVRPVP